MTTERAFRGIVAAVAVLLIVGFLALIAATIVILFSEPSLPPVAGIMR